MKTSLIMAVRNEGRSIARVLKCIIAQTMLPDEIIIADAGSIDNTIEIIESFVNRLPINLIKIGPAFPGKARNEAIKQSKHPVVVITDAGLTFKADWLENLIEPFRKNDKLDVVFGGYTPKCESKFKEAIALFVASDKPSGYEFRFPVMPSMAIKKEVYESVGGCPEELRAAEDSVFFRLLFEKNIKYEVVKNAVVDWEMDGSWRYLARKSFQAAKCEIVSGYIRKRSLFLLGLYPLLILLSLSAIFIWPYLSFFPLMLFGTRVWGSRRMDHEIYDSLISSLLGITILAVVTLVADIFHIIGNIVGFTIHFKIHGNTKLKLWRGARF